MARGTFELAAGIALPSGPDGLDAAPSPGQRRGSLGRHDLSPGAAAVAGTCGGRSQPSRATRGRARLHVAVAGQPVRAAVRAAVTSALERLLGLSIDLTEFYQFAAHHRRLGPLAQRFRGMKPPRFATVFEGVINAIACQQMTLTLGIRLLNRLAVALRHRRSMMAMRPFTPSLARRTWPG